jgi:hypothetical protein
VSLLVVVQERDTNAMRVKWAIKMLKIFFIEYPIV